MQSFVCFASFPSSILYCLACTINATKIRQQWRRKKQIMPSDCKFEFVSLNYSCVIILNYISLFFFFKFGHSQQHSQSTYVLYRSQSTEYCSARTYLSSSFPKTTKKASNSSPKQQHPNRPVDAVQLHRTKPQESNPIRSDTHNRMFCNQKRQQPCTVRYGRDNDCTTHVLLYYISPSFVSFFSISTFFCFYFFL